MARVRWLLLRVGLAVLGSVLGLAGAELSCRLVGLDPLLMIDDQGKPARGWVECIQPAAGIGYELVPGVCGANSLGHRDREPPAGKPPGSKRVIALGDSISEQRAWVDILELMLNERLDTEVDVWNLGVTGYSVLNELEVLRLRALDFEPDLVVLQVCLNDYGITPVLFRHEGEVRWLRAATGNMGPVQLWLFERSALARYLTLRGASFDMQGVGNEEHTARVDAALAEMLALCEARGIPFELVIFPTLEPQQRWAPTEAKTYERFLEQARIHGLSHTDLTPRMMGGDVGELMRYRGDEVYADLDAYLARWGVAPQASTMLQGMAPEVLGVGKPIRENQYQDTTHPNFLGHYLAAEALADKLAPMLE